MSATLPSGLTKLSEIYQIRALVTEAVANTYIEEAIDTGIDAMQQEVLAIWYASFDLAVPDLIAGGAGAAAAVRTAVLAQLVMRTKAGSVDLDDFDLIAKSRDDIVQAGDFGAGGAGIGMGYQDLPEGGTIRLGDFPIAIVTSRQMFLGVAGNANTGVKGASCRLYVQRCKAQAAVYSALIGARNA